MMPVLGKVVRRQFRHLTDEEVDDASSYVAEKLAGKLPAFVKHREMLLRAERTTLAYLCSTCRNLLFDHLRAVSKRNRLPVIQWPERYEPVAIHNGFDLE